MKYNIGDLVWVIAGDFIRQGVVLFVLYRSVHESATSRTEEYTIKTNLWEESFFAEDVFRSLDELVNAKTIPYES